MYLYHYSLIRALTAGANYHSGTIALPYKIESNDDYLAFYDRLRGELGIKDSAVILSLNLLHSS